MFLFPFELFLCLLSVVGKVKYDFTTTTITNVFIFLVGGQVSVKFGVHL